MNAIAKGEILTAQLQRERCWIRKKPLRDRVIGREVIGMLRSRFFKALQQNFDRHQMPNKEFGQQFIFHRR